MASSRSFVFSDPLPYQSSLRISDVNIIPTAKGAFRAELTQFNFDKLWMQRGYENLPHVVVGEIGSHRKSITFLTEAQEMTYCGQQVPSGSIVLQRIGSQHRQNPANRRWGSMSLPNEDFQTAYKAVTGREFEEQSGKSVVQPEADNLLRLLQAHAGVGMIAEATPDIFAMPEVGHALEQKLIHLMIKALTGSAFSMPSTGINHHEAIIERLERFLEENSDKPLYLTEICAAIKVAERTLRSACNEHLGMGPIRYLKLRRMHLVRRALLHADPSKTTVTHVATNYGFWELGRFSVAYRELFGELPSASLRTAVIGREKRSNRPSSLPNLV